MNAAARILDALPTYGEPAIGFSTSGRSLHSQGLVVEFASAAGRKWVGNFVRGLSAYDLVQAHPNDKDLLIIAGGQAYVIEPDSMACTAHLGGAIVDVWPHPSRRWLILNHHNVYFTALSPMGTAWSSRRVSWDGVRSTRFNGDILSGEAWKPDDSWVPFSVNLNTGELSGGSYEPHREDA